MVQKKKTGSVKLVLLFFAGTLWFVILCNVPNTMNILALKFFHPLSTSFMRYNSLSHPFERIKYSWAPSKNISGYLKKAVVISEDDRFYQHIGIDWIAVKSAFETNWKRKKLAFGASTISQQLAKNLYLSPSKDPIRKMREAILALFLDAYLSKERILEIYLNIVEWGPNVYGAEEAARYYFKTGAKNLNADQAAFLASILPSPVKMGKRGFHMTSRAASIARRIR